VPTTDLGYYVFVGNQKRALARTILRLCLLVFAAAILASCHAPDASIAFIDPILAAAVPDSMEWYAAAARRVVVLPETDAAATLYADIDTMKPRAIVLSPLLGSELLPILGRDETTRVAYIGYTMPTAHSRLFSATFTAVEAAEAAASVLAARAAHQSAMLAYAVFAGYPPETSARAAEALAQAYGKAGGIDPPRVEIIAEPFSQALADRLRSLDIRAAYVSAPEGETERWMAQAFDQSAYVIAARAFPLRPALTLAKAQVVWDMKATLDDVIIRLNASQNGDKPGIWQILPSKAVP